MPTLSINHDQAVNILEKAFNNLTDINDAFSNNIKYVIFGNHKTYKYVFVNGLLAKATNEECHHFFQGDHPKRRKKLNTVLGWESIECVIDDKQCN